MSDCSTSAMKLKEVHCRNMKECVEMGVVVPDECFRYCHGGDSDAVRFERLAQVAREMYAALRTCTYGCSGGCPMLNDGCDVDTGILGVRLEAIGVVW